MTSMSTAIIMVAVLTIANLFAFGVMSTGFLTAARAKQAAQGGVGESISTLQPKGAVIASGDTAKNAVNHIDSSYQVRPGQTTVNLAAANTVLTYFDPNSRANIKTPGRSYPRRRFTMVS